MSYLFGQTWVWLLISFLLGALVTWFIQRAFRKPKVTVSEERFTGPAVKAKEKTKVKKAAAATPVRDSALGTLDDDERTQALKPPRKDEFTDDTPTTRIPVQTEADIQAAAANGAGAGSAAGSGDKAGAESGSLSGSLAAGALGAAAVSGAGKDFDADSTTKATAAESAKGDSAWSSAPPSSDLSASSAASVADPFAGGSTDSARSIEVSGSAKPDPTAKLGAANLSGASSADTVPSGSSSAGTGALLAGASATGAAAAGGAAAGGAAAGGAAAGAEPFGAGSARPLAGGAAPSTEYTVKGNEDSMLYHTTDSPYYGRTVAEVWFKSPADAERAGFIRWTRDKSAAHALAEPTWDQGAYPGSAKPLAGGKAPTDAFTVKGNEDSKLYHTEESPYYSRTVAEVWFKTPADAEAAGFSPWTRSKAPQGLVAPQWEAGPYANSAKPLAGGKAPSDEFTVKGNEDSMLYHSTDSPYYSRTVAEVWFKTPADAEAAGFSPWTRSKAPQGLVAPQWEAGPYANSAKPLAGGKAPSDEFTVKGNEDSMLYHSTDSPYYSRTVAEVWFKTPADAEAAGFSPWTRSKSPQGLAPQWEAGPYPGSAKPTADGSAPAPEFTVKGNLDSMLFHTEESAFYSVTTAEVWFRTADEAERAGFAPWNRVGGAERGQTAVPQQALPRDTGPHGPNSAKPKADGSAPSGDYTVKGNADSMLFHTTDSPYYTRTKAEVWFKTAADAERAGFTAWNRRRSEKPS
ncbi:sunset domain-containing protein [Actinokineospora sp. HUAS TT18]|uniref:sunset domain-containing protein n=1 Tax=Actinokineospora sp. HUAS TT18 TaxID=3447451 RepID=UPI003F526509